MKRNKLIWENSASRLTWYLIWWFAFSERMTILKTHLMTAFSLVKSYQIWASLITLVACPILQEKFRGNSTWTTLENSRLSMSWAKERSRATIICESRYIDTSSSRSRISILWSVGMRCKNLMHALNKLRKFLMKWRRTLSASSLIKLGLLKSEHSYSRRKSRTHFSSQRRWGKTKSPLQSFWIHFTTS